MTITLAAYEIEIATRIGQWRAQRARGNPQFPYAQPQDNEKNHILGALGECAAAKALGLYWNMGVDTGTRVPDIGIAEHGTAIEVRWASWDEVKVKDTDSDDARVLLVTGGPETFELRGWCPAAFVRANGVLKAPAPGKANYFLAADELWSMTDLVEQLAAARMYAARA